MLLGRTFADGHVGSPWHPVKERSAPAVKSSAEPHAGQGRKRRHATGPHLKLLRDLHCPLPDPLRIVGSFDAPGHHSPAPPHRGSDITPVSSSVQGHLGGTMGSIHFSGCAYR